MNATERDRDILARTLYGEARGEGLDGQIAVAWTIRNRVFDGKAKSWCGEGYAGVYLKPWQFSCWNQNDPNYAYLRGAKPISAAQFAQAQRAADQVMSGSVPDPTGGATHYYATTMPKAPAWAAKANKLAASASTADPGAAQRSTSATRAAMVLSDLLQRADKRAGELASAYDRARIAGLTCERSYDSLCVRTVAQ